MDEGVALKGYHHDIWTGYFVPKSTPAAQVAALNKALAATLGDPKIRTALEAQNQIVAPVQSLDDAAKAYSAGTQKFTTIAKAIKLEAQ